MAGKQAINLLRKLVTYTKQGGNIMGIFLNPGNEGFQSALNSQIYIDKTQMLEYTNSVLDSEQRYICVSRPRRFGKSITAEMLDAIL